MFNSFLTVSVPALFNNNVSERDIWGEQRHLWEKSSFSSSCNGTTKTRGWRTERWRMLYYSGHLNPRGNRRVRVKRQESIWIHWEWRVIGKWDMEVEEYEILFFCSTPHPRNRWYCPHVIVYTPMNSVHMVRVDPLESSLLWSYRYTKMLLFKKKSV